MAEALKETILKSPTITVVRKSTTLGIAFNPKTSYSLGNFHVSDY